MNLTPEEKFKQDVWWILQEIKKDELLTPKGKKVEFSIRGMSKTRSIRREDVDYGFPHEETQRKLLYKLKEWKAIDELEPVDSIFRGSDILNPRIYEFVIRQPKFNELYRQYEEIQKKVGSFNEEVLKTQQLLDKLEDDINRKTKGKAKYNNGILYFRDTEIDFRNKQNQKDLLATLFEDPKKNWYYDEIQDKWDEMIKLGAVDRRKDYWKKFYSAGDDINTAVAIETQVKDFIIKNTKEIRINPKYI